MNNNISPLDGRYWDKVQEIGNYFSNVSYTKKRCYIEKRYLHSLIKFLEFNEQNLDYCFNYIEKKIDVNRIDQIEKEINHDVKAIEYYIKEELKDFEYKEYVHFGLTSQDINNTALTLMLKECINDVIIKNLNNVLSVLENLGKCWIRIPMLSRTHGQPASPSTLGKEILVFHERLKVEVIGLMNHGYTTKFGGAVGNMNAHYVAYPLHDWKLFAINFIQSLGLKRQKLTTQIDNYDNMSKVFHNIERINTILLDLCKDIWTYISLDYFKLEVNPNEVGSSTMPHKVNPIDFENAEGNLGLANAIFHYMSSKLPISRLQRDLSDSTVVRNIGVPLGHSLLSYKSILKGLNKLVPNDIKIESDLDKNYVVIMEGIQTILRKYKYKNAYEEIKEFTRGKELTKRNIIEFINNLNVKEDIKQELKQITPSNYYGNIL